MRQTGPRQVVVDEPMEERRVGRRRAAPPQRVQERREVLGPVEAALAEVGPGLVVEDGTVELAVPEDLQLLTLRVVVGAREADP